MGASVNNGRGKSGFVALELASALMLLAVVMTVGYHLLAYELAVGRATGLARERVASMQAVEAVWRNSGGRVALAVRADDGRWSVLDFPDEEWLPMMGTAEEGFLWRRRLVVDNGSALWWIEQFNGNTHEWTWWDSQTAGHESFPETNEP
ncbi:MAG: hypothetical protein AB3N64_12860 [Puniceicoccaceae bacterium]